MTRWAPTLLILHSFLTGVALAATAEQWRSRKIYQVRPALYKNLLRLTVSWRL